MKKTTTSVSRFIFVCVEQIKHTSREDICMWYVDAATFTSSSPTATSRLAALPVGLMGAREKKSAKAKKEKKKKICGAAQSSRSTTDLVQDF